MATMQAIFDEVASQFPGVSNLGITCCRRIGVKGCDPTVNNGKAWSQHAWGNALDIGVRNLSQGDSVYRWLLANKARLGIGGICWRAFGGCDPNAHQDHIHLEGSPKRTGTPPCAGGAGDRPRASNIGWSGESIGERVTNVTDAIGRLFSADPWLRVLWFGLGAAAVVGGVTLFISELTGVDAKQLVPVGRIADLVKG